MAGERPTHAEPGLRYDYQEQTPNTKDAFGPRLGFAYDLGGAGRTVVRGGIGKFYDST